MNKKKADIKSPRTSAVSKAVYTFLWDMNLNTYPLNPRSLAGKLLNNTSRPLMISTYSEFAKFRGSTVSEAIATCFKSVEGVTIYFQTEDLHTILYNDLVKSEGRVNWTVAHELGHVMLNHYQLMDPVILKRAPLKDQEYAILEKEADLFAKYLLCHPLVLKACGFDNSSDIAKVCKISGDAAKNRLSDLRNFYKFQQKFNEYDKKILTLFSSFAYQRKCKKCGKIFSLGKSCFCPVCGGSDLIFYNGPEACYQKEFDPFYYTVCPICTTAITDKHNCEHCGGDLTNHCMVNGCHRSLPADARYCNFCGGPSQYSYNGQLAPWRI